VPFTALKQVASVIVTRPRAPGAVTFLFVTSLDSRGRKRFALRATLLPHRVLPAAEMVT